MFGLLVKVVGSPSVDPGLIPGSSGRKWRWAGNSTEIANSANKFFIFKKLEIFIQVFIDPT